MPSNSGKQYRLLVIGGNLAYHRSDRSNWGAQHKAMYVAANEEFRVVCLGGSAGGLQAYTGILRHMPAATGMAFVIAAHRSSEITNLLPKILAGVTTMAVIEVEEGMLLESNHIYLMPPHTEMTVKNKKFALQPPRKSHGWPITISLFLLSLAEAYGQRAIAVILSGTGHDGSSALQAFKAAGGLTFTHGKDSCWIVTLQCRQESNGHGCAE